MKFGSLFAGVGGFDLGFERAGMTCAFQVEWDKYCQQVLAYHWPDVPRWGDVSEVNGAELPPVDVITFGSPCQDLSTAGKRAGLEGDRSNLYFQALRIIKEMRDATGNTFPRVAVWENVPGAFTSNEGRDFGAVLDGLANVGAVGIEWAVLDARWFGVPQRRRRVFVVAQFDPATAERGGRPIFSVGKGSARDYQTRYGKGKGTPGTTNGSVDAGSGEIGPLTSSDLMKHQGSNQAVEAGYLQVVDAFHNTSFGGWEGSDVNTTLRSVDYKEPHTLVIDGTRVDDVRIYEDGNTPCLTSHMGTGGNNVPLVADVFVKSRRAQSETDFETWIPGEVSPTLNGMDNTGDTRATVVIPIQGTIIGRSDTAGPQGKGVGEPNDPMYTLDTISRHAIGFSHTQGLDAQPSESAFPTLRANGSGQEVNEGMQVRRLTPIECERLMGWPDNHTLFRADGRTNPDSQRYKMCGNGVASPVAEWVARAILDAERGLEAP